MHIENLCIIENNARKT